MPTDKKFDVAFLVFLLTVVLTSSLVASYAAYKGLEPFAFINRQIESAAPLVRELFRERSPLLGPMTFEQDGVRVHQQQASWNGLTVLQGILPDGPQLRLMDMDGQELHRWDVDFFAAYPEPDHLYPPRIVPKSELNIHTQGMFLHRDGRALVVIGDYGAVMLDKCSNVLWTVDRMVHHSVTRTADGYWIPGHRDVRHIADDLLFSDPATGQPITREALAEGLFNSGNGTYENLLLLLDDQGKVIKAFSVLRALAEGGFDKYLFDILHFSKHDPTHVNDIDIVTAPLADKLSGVEAGDLLVSLRQLHMLAVFDRHDGHIKWHHSGPWLRQHDPDITPEGNIVVFDNGRQGLGLPGSDGSRITEFDPATGDVITLFPKADGKAELYTDIMGNHQRLPNGNRLISESRRGRVLEIDSGGGIVWSYVSEYGDGYASLIEMAQRYPEDYFDVDNWSCP